LKNNSTQGDFLKIATKYQKVFGEAQQFYRNSQEGTNRLVG
jgi:hypothetical protein